MIDNRVAIVCWYESHDKEFPNCIRLVHNNFEILGYDVKQIPFLQLKNEYHDYLDRVDAMLKEFDPKYVLWWNWSSITDEELEKIRIKHYERIFAVFNWDDPHCWINGCNKMKNFDISFSTCYGTLNNYKELGVKYAHYLLPGFSPITHFYEPNHQYECDVSFVCTNLYRKGSADHDDKILIDRYQMVQSLENDDRINFHLYGPEHLREAAPNSYRGPISYENNRLVFSNSKVNINVHGAYGDGYLNERTVTILGSKGLMLIDNVPGLERNLEDNVNCVVINNPSNINDQVYDIISNYDDYVNIKEAGYELACQKFTYTNWTNTIIDGFEQFNNNYCEHKLGNIELVLGMYLESHDYPSVKDIHKFRLSLQRVCPNATISWGLTLNYIKLPNIYVQSVMSLIRSYVDMYGDSMGYTFGFLNTLYTVEELVSYIDEFKVRYSELLGYNTFEDIPNKYVPKTVMSYSINHRHIEWFRDNMNVRCFMSWTATQTNVDGFSGSGTILSPYYSHKNNPMIPAQSEDDSSNCLMLNTLSVDPIGCRYNEGESRWTIHPADPLTDGASQIELIKRYMYNYCNNTTNKTNYLCLYFDSNWILNNSRLKTSWDSILEFIGEIKLKITSIHDYGERYMTEYVNNDNIEFIYKTRGLGYEVSDGKNNYVSSYDDQYVWYETKEFRMILEYDNLNSKYNIIDYTDYTCYDGVELEKIADTNYVTHRNYKLEKKGEIDYNSLLKCNAIIKNLKN